MRLAAEKAVKEIPGVSGALVTLTAEKKGGRTSDDAPPPPKPQPRSAQAAAAPNRQPPQPRPAAKPGIPGVGAIIAVASGKGGVGKSTTAVNLALGMSANGLKVGILDADIYGPSMPRLLGLSGRPETVEGRTLKPMENYGVKVMSMGFMVDEDTPMIWRRTDGHVGADTDAARSGLG